ncbi:DnaJ C-terminal domain-containing protein [Zafaria sp. J156]|uniref:DnaJ C-terminal domain-containing protein n=1 Tax=Zafaria sp. J156 TaxID=3116490 RepID=UPI002E77FF6C|nr:DnaJ C-terminal domain-containing protein [Zafaria sp. J156]MEE1621389.1 DnaJ C-terminal domain-containing protein [Zafaria sp. J156]
MASQDWVDKDFYAILGVSKDASEADIKKAYRKLARTHHPDTNAGNPGAEQKFKDITEANSVLSDPEQRQQYDAIRAMGSGARFQAGGPGGAAGAGFDDIFGNLFGGGPGGARRGPAGFGGGQVPPEFADLFGGFGGQPGGFGQPAQKGADRTATTTISFGGSLRGTTVSLREPTGEVIEVRIPAGIKDGQSVRVRGKGQPGPAGQGDLLVKVSVKAHPFFQREGNNIRIHVPVTFSEAALGGSIEVPTPAGDTVKVKVPAGSGSGRTLRLGGRGVKTAKEAGDLLVVLDVVVPQNLNAEAEAAVKAFAEATAGADPRAGLAAKAAL